MDIAARIDELVNRGFDNGLIAAVTGVAVTDVVDFRRTRVAPQDPMSGGSTFAHLHEDEGHFIEISDGYYLNVHTGNGDGTLIYPDGRINSFLEAGEPDPTVTVYELWPDLEAGPWPVFTWNQDGSLHWGDGASPPLASIGKVDADYADAGLKFGTSGVEIFSPPGTRIPEYSFLEVSRRTSTDRASIVSGNYIGDGNGGSGGSGFETAIGPEAIGSETWPSFVLTDWENYSHPIWGVYPSGKMVWSAPDGLSAPDVALYRATDGQPVIHGPLGLFASGDDSGDDTGHGVYLSPDGIYGFFPADVDPTTQLLTSAYDGGDGSGWFNIHKDGSLHWGDGVNPPDVSIARLNAGGLETNGYIYSEDLAAAGGAGTWTGLNPNGYLELQGIADGGAFITAKIAGDAHPLFTVDDDGSLHWGDGIGAPDVQAGRNGAQAFAVGDPAHFDSGDGSATWIGRDSSGDTYVYVQAQDGVEFVQVKPNVTAALSVSKHGAGIQLHSADGTAYNITVTNDGTLDIAAA